MADKEYIERDCIVNSIRKSFDFYYQIPIYPSDREVQNIVNRVKRIVQELPAADVVEVVRCKDCKNAYMNSFSAQSCVAMCRFLANRSNGELAIVQQDDFCSRGERKEDTPCSK